MIIHQWTARGFCPGCNKYFWTNPGNFGVVCSCGMCEITDHTTVQGVPVTDEQVFKIAVALDLNVLVEDLILEEVP